MILENQIGALVLKRYLEDHGINADGWCQNNSRSEPMWLMVRGAIIFSTPTQPSGWLLLCCE